MTVVTGSLIRIDIELKSQVNETVMLPNLRGGSEASGIEVWDSAGKALDPLEEFRESNYQVHHIFATFVPAGRSVIESIPVSHWFDLRKPGKYTLMVRIKDPISKALVESNQLTVTVMSNKQ